MRNIKILLLVFLLTAVSILPSCDQDMEFLDTKPMSEYSSVDFWKSPGLVQTFINGIYIDVYGFPFNFLGVGLSNFSGDESWFNEGEGIPEFNKCLITPDWLAGFDSWHQGSLKRVKWENLYKAVRKVNLIFDNVKNMNYADEAAKKNMIGEAYFLRAALYHNLISMYGGVPLIKHAYTLSDDYIVPRDKYSDCVDFITGQLDSAALYLPTTQSGINLGRVTKGAALTLKSRVLLYAASDLHHNFSSYAPGYSNPELLGYVGANRTALWQKAKDAAKAVMDMGLYSLYKPDPAPGDSIARNFIDYFLSRSFTSEDILIQFLSAKTGIGSWEDHDPYTYLYPNGYHGWGGMMPTSEMADDYEMKDGSSFSWNNPVHKSSPYLNRDARFYATLLYEGSPWAVRPTDVRSIDPWNRIQTGYVEYIDGTGNSKILLGADAGLIDDWSGGVYSGYFLRKFFDPNNDYTKQKEDVPFRHMRYAEVLLNYAEACIELGEYGEALKYINMIRKRAGQPAINETGPALRERYRHERRIELAFENQRFFDVRRWVVGSKAYHPIHKVVIKYSTNQNITNYNKADGSFWSKPSFTTEILDNYAWDNKAYFIPIKRDEMNKNNKLIQNPGY